MMAELKIFVGCPLTPFNGPQVLQLAFVYNFIERVLFGLGELPLFTTIFGC